MPRPFKHPLSLFIASLIPYQFISSSQSSQPSSSLTSTRPSNPIHPPATLCSQVSLFVPFYPFTTSQLSLLKFCFHLPAQRSDWRCQLSFRNHWWPQPKASHRAQSRRPTSNLQVSQGIYISLISSLSVTLPYSHKLMHITLEINSRCFSRLISIVSVPFGPKMALAATGLVR